MPATLQRLERRTLIPQPRAQLFPFFSDPGNLEALTPPSLGFKILDPSPGGTREGQLIDYRIKLHGLPLRWRTLITRWDPPHGFVDVAVHSPYAFWHHSHRFEARGRSTLMTDTVLYSLPLAPLGEWVAGALVRRQVEGIFDHRQAVLAQSFGARPA